MSALEDDFVLLEKLWKRYRECSQWQIAKRSFLDAKGVRFFVLWALAVFVVILFAAGTFCQDIGISLVGAALYLIFLFQLEKSIKERYSEHFNGADSFSSLRWKEKRMLRYSLFRKEANPLTNGKSSKEISGMKKLYSEECALRVRHSVLVRPSMIAWLTIASGIAIGVLTSDGVLESPWIIPAVILFLVLGCYIWMLADSIKSITFLEEEFGLFLDWMARER